MNFRPLLAGALVALAVTATQAGEMAGKTTGSVGSIVIQDAYARSSGAAAMAGAAFMTIINQGEADDRLVSAASDAAARVELHTHIEGDDGVMRMRPVEDGFAVPAGGTHMLERGGDHVMLMGLSQPLVDGETVEITLTFETAGDVTFEFEVDSARMPAGHGHHSN